MSNTLPSPNSPLEIAVESNPIIEELHILQQKHTEVYDNYLKHKILYNAISEISKDGSTDLASKVKDILYGHECYQASSLDCDGFSASSNVLLGVKNLKSQELSRSESAILKKELATVLKQKYDTICADFVKITGEDLTKISPVTNGFTKFDLNGDEVFLSLKSKLSEQQKIYMENLLKQHEILEEMTKLRLDKLPEFCDVKLKEYKVKSQMYQLQTKIVKETTRVDIFMENSNTLKAYQELIEDIKEQQMECQIDIQYLKEMKEKYENIKCKQFEQILKSYVQYKSALERKKAIIKNLQS